MSLNLSLVKMPHSNFKRKATEFEAGVGRCSCGQTFECASERELQSVTWSLAEFHHNKIVQSSHENYFNVCRQHKEK